MLHTALSILTSPFTGSKPKPSPVVVDHEATKDSVFASIWSILINPQKCRAGKAEAFLVALADLGIHHPDDLIDFDRYDSEFAKLLESHLLNAPLKAIQIKWDRLETNNIVPRLEHAEAASRHPTKRNLFGREEGAPDDLTSPTKARQETTLDQAQAKRVIQLQRELDALKGKSGKILSLASLKARTVDADEDEDEDDSSDGGSSTDSDDSTSSKKSKRHKDKDKSAKKTAKKFKAAIDRLDSEDTIATAEQLSLMAASTEGLLTLTASGELISMRRKHAGTKKRTEKTVKLLQGSGGSDPELTPLDNAYSVVIPNSLGEIDEFYSEQIHGLLHGRSSLSPIEIIDALKNIVDFKKKVDQSYESVIGPQGLVVGGKPNQWSNHVELQAGIWSLWNRTAAKGDFTLLNTGFHRMMEQVARLMSTSHNNSMRPNISMEVIFRLTGHECLLNSCGSNAGGCEQFCNDCSPPRLSGLLATPSPGGPPLPIRDPEYDAWLKSDNGKAAQPKGTSKVQAFEDEKGRKVKREARPLGHGKPERMDRAKYLALLGKHQDLIGPPADLAGKQPLAFPRG